MSDANSREKTPWVELAIGGIGALLVVLMVSYLLYDAFGTGKAKPADIVLEQGTFSRQSAGWRVPVTVRNLGDRPAQAVELRAELQLASGQIEEAALTLDFLPSKGTVEAVFLIKQDPDGGELRLRAVGYLAP